MDKVLIVEDDLMIADLLEEVLIGAGYTVCGIASTVAVAVTLCNRHNPELAVIDVRLADGESGTDIAGLVDHRDTLGILYATGNAGAVLLKATDGDACITKPYHAGEILRALQIVREIKRKGTASAPFPRSFQLLKGHQACQATFGT